MKLTTALLLSVFGMTLSSISVWGLAPAKSGSAPTSSTPAVAGTQKDALEIADLVGLGGTPTFTAGTTLVMEGRLGHPTLAAGRDTETFLFLDVKASAENTARTTTPVNLAIVLDRSGSMQGERMQNALAAAQGMIQRLRDGDTVSVVGYNTSTQVLLAPTSTSARLRRGRPRARRDTRRARRARCRASTTPAGRTCGARARSPRRTA